MSNFINAVPVDQLAVIVAGLMKEDIRFRVTADDDSGKHWTIELTGY